MRAGMAEPYGRDIADSIALYIKNMSVVDAGCGPGLTSFYLAGYAKNVIGVDNQSYAIEYAKKYFANEARLSFVEKNFFDLEENCCDVVCGISIGQILENHLELLRIPKKYLILVSGIKRSVLPKRDSLAINEEILIRHQLNYKKLNISTSFGQAFKSFEESITFIKSYQLSDDPVNFAKENLTKLEGDYKYYLANKKELEVLVIESVNYDEKQFRER